LYMAAVRVVTDLGNHQDLLCDAIADDKIQTVTQLEGTRPAFVPTELRTHTHAQREIRTHMGRWMCMADTGARMGGGPAAFEYLKAHATVDVAAFEAASGVGVKVPREDVARVVAQLVEAHRESIVTERYKYHVGPLFAKVSLVPPTRPRTLCMCACVCVCACV
jgi:uncharacterized protein (DUF1786 family)